MSRSRYALVWLAVLGTTIGLSGCGSGNGSGRGPSKPFAGVKLAVGAVGDPAILKAVENSRGEWQETRGAELTIRNEPVDPASPGEVDVLLFPGDRLGELVDLNVLALIPESALQEPSGGPSADADSASKSGPAVADPLQFSDFVPASRDQVSKYGKDRVALPFGTSALVLAYRKEAFEADENRKAASANKLTLAPPKTWEQLDALAKFFQGLDWNGDGKPDFGIALALGSDPDGVGTAAFLSRAAALGQHRDQFSFLFDSDSMEPRIASPPFVEALTSLVALKGLGPPGMEKFDSTAARAAFRNGNVAMLIDRAEQAAAWSDGKAIIVAQLPGSERVYDPARKVEETVSTPNRPSYLPGGGGWLVGIAKRSNGRQHDAALDFAKFLVSPETSAMTRVNRAVPTLPVRATHLGQGIPDPQSAPGVESRTWSEAVSRTLNAERVVPGLRIPEARAYLADVDKARASAAVGESAKSALETAAKAWADRNRALGEQRQLWHYRRSLNSLITTPEPPAR